MIDRVTNDDDVPEGEIVTAINLLEDAVTKNLMDSYSVSAKINMLTMVQRFLKSPLYDELTLDEVELYRQTSSISMLKNMGRKSLSYTKKPLVMLQMDIPVKDINLLGPPEDDSAPKSPIRSPKGVGTPRRLLSSFFSPLLALVKKKKGSSNEEHL
jgi:hypothetical protein